MTGIRIVVIFTLFSLLLTGQTDSTVVTNAGPGMLKRVGRAALRQGDARSASFYLEAGAKKAPRDSEMLTLLGEAYMRQRDYQRAKVAFLRAYNAEPKKAAEALYYHAMMQKSSGRYDTAKIVFEKFRKEYKGSDRSMKRSAGREIVFCDSVNNFLKAENKIRVERLDTSINKVNNEGSPVLLDENTLLYSSLRTESVEYNYPDSSTTIGRKLYLARKSGKAWKYAGPYRQISDEGLEASNGAISADGQRLYLSLCKKSSEGEMQCGIYLCRRQGKRWSDPERLPKEIISRKFTATMPFVTTDPLKGYDIVYFSSNDKRGKGGYDIWFTTYDPKKKRFKPAKNAGTKINTPHDELTPFYDAETKQLFFSSEGHGSLGGLDVFSSVGQASRWAQPLNIGAGINSGADELYYTISPTRRDGFFVSNRKGGNALKNSTCCDDIYRYTVPEYKPVHIEGTVEDVVEQPLSLANATVDVYVAGRDPETRSFVRSVTTDSSGKYQLTLEPEQDYHLVIRKDNYLGIPEHISTRGVDSIAMQPVRLMKRPKGTIEIPDFHYDFDGDKLSPRQERIADSMIVTLMEANPELILEVQSHTDSKGSDAYNQRLSQRRANNLVKYLVSKKIDPERLKPMGYGETKPKVPNTNPDGSDNPENRYKNRRTELRIIGTIKTNAPEDEVE